MDIFNSYRNHKELVEKVVEVFFEICLYIVIFLGHKVDHFILTYEYKVFIILMMVSGVLLYNIKSQHLKKMINDIVCKFLAPFLGSLIIAKLTGKIDVLDILPALYTVPIIYIYYLHKRKKEFIIKGNRKKMSPNEFLKEKIGIYAIVPMISVYVVAIIVALLNVSTEVFILSLVGTHFIFNSLYSYIIDKFIGNKCKMGVHDNVKNIANKNIRTKRKKCKKKRK